MSKQGTIHRYSLIIEKTRDGHCASFAEIQNYLHDHGFEISARTLQRDIEAIRIEFGIEIKYNRQNNYYTIIEAESFNLDSFLRLLGIVATANLLTETLNEGKEALKYISFEAEGNMKGLESLQILLFAVRNRRTVSLRHNNYISGKVNQFTVDPYLIKEYQNRWYFFGYIYEIKQFRTLGIDRAEALKVLSKTFIRDKSIHPQEVFKNIIGLNYSTGKVEEVLLSLSTLQAKYVLSLPLHHSQKVVKENSKEVVISLTLVPNFELLQKILMMGDAVKVLQPASLVKEVKESLKAALKNYTKK